MTETELTIAGLEMAQRLLSEAELGDTRIVCVSVMPIGETCRVSIHLWDGSPAEEIAAMMGLKSSNLKYDAKHVRWERVDDTFTIELVMTL